MSSEIVKLQLIFRYELQKLLTDLQVRFTETAKLQPIYRCEVQSQGGICRRRDSCVSRQEDVRSLQSLYINMDSMNVFIYLVITVYIGDWSCTLDVPGVMYDDVLTPKGENQNLDFHSFLTMQT